MPRFHLISWSLIFIVASLALDKYLYVFMVAKVKYKNIKSLPISATQILVLLLLMNPLSVFAMDLDLKAEAREVNEYNSNLFLTTAPHTNTWGQGVDVVLGSKLKAGGLDSNINTNFNNRMYEGASQLNYFNQLFDMKNSYVFNKSRVGFNAQYNMDTSSAAMDDPDDELGFVFQRIPRVSRMIQPNYTYHISDKTIVNLAYKYRDTQYDKIIEYAPVPFPNVVGHTTTADISHQFSKDLQLTGSMFYKDFLLVHEAETDKLVSNGALQSSPQWTKEIYTEIAMLGANYSFSDTLKLSAAAGFQSNSQSSQAYNVLSSTGAVVSHIGENRGNTFSDVYLAKLSKRVNLVNDAHSDMAFESSRSVIPSPGGVLVGYDKYAATLAHTFSPKWSAKIGLTYADRSYPVTQKLNSTVFGAQAGVTWKMGAGFELSGNYQYFQLNDNALAASGLLDIAESNAVIFNIGYVFGKHLKY